MKPDGNASDSDVGITSDSFSCTGADIMAIQEVPICSLCHLKIQPNDEVRVHGDIASHVYCMMNVESNETLEHTPGAAGSQKLEKFFTKPELDTTTQRNIEIAIAAANKVPPVDPALAVAVKATKKIENRKEASKDATEEELQTSAIR